MGPEQNRIKPEEVAPEPSEPQKILKEEPIEEIPAKKTDNKSKEENKENTEADSNTKREEEEASWVEKAAKDLQKTKPVGQTQSRDIIVEPSPAPLDQEEPEPPRGLIARISAFIFSIFSPILVLF